MAVDILLRKLQHSLIDHVLYNIPETPTSISTMILGVMILIVDFSSKLIFAGKFVILRKSDELLFHKDPSVLTILDVYWACALETYDSFPRLGARGDYITS